MRNPDRLDPFYEELKRIHKESFPDLRFGQFMSCLLFKVSKFDPFYLEDNEFLERVKAFENEMKGDQ